MIISRLTSRARTMIRQAVRRAMRLQDGGRLTYVVEDGCAMLTRKPAPEGTADPFPTFSEWAGDADTRAYSVLGSNS
jgi:antitoxin PrlF